MKAFFQEVSGSFWFRTFRSQLRFTRFQFIQFKGSSTSLVRAVPEFLGFPYITGNSGFGEISRIRVFSGISGISWFSGSSGSAGSAGSAGSIPAIRVRDAV